jgi:hypothetical protein
MPRDVSIQLRRGIVVVVPEPPVVVLVVEVVVVVLNVELVVEVLVCDVVVELVVVVLNVELELVVLGNEVVVTVGIVVVVVGVVGQGTACRITLTRSWISRISVFPSKLASPPVCPLITREMSS